MTPAEAMSFLSAVSEYAPLVDDNAEVHRQWQDLVTRYSIVGKQAHDACHVAAMIAHGLDALLTFDTGDFARFSGLVRVRSPDDEGLVPRSEPA